MLASPFSGFSSASRLPNRHIRADHQHHVGKLSISAVVDLVENAPSSQHPHDRGLATARCHLAGVAQKSRVAFSFAVVTGFVAWHFNALQEIRSGLCEKDDRQCSLILGEEQPLLSAISRPPLDQFQSRAADAGIALRLPLLNPLSHEVYKN